MLSDFEHGTPVRRDVDSASRRDVVSPQLKDVRLLSAGWINKYLLTYTLPDSSLYEYESVSRKGPDAYAAALRANAAGDRRDLAAADAVCIVPVLPDGSLLMIREFRYPVNAWVVAFPAGLLEPGESVRECIDRELREETGYKVRDAADPASVRTLPQSGYSSVGMGEENVLVAIAQVEPAGDAATEPGEFIEAFTLAQADIPAFLEANTDLIGTRAQLLLEASRRPEFLDRAR